MKTKMLAWLMGVVLVMGCASEPEGPRTEVDGAVVSEAEHDPDREFSDEEVESFAAAYPAVTAIQQRYQEKIQIAEGAEREELINESSAETEEAMAAHGLSAEEFNAIAVRLPDDDELRARVQEAIRQLEERRIEETQEHMESE